MDDDGCTDVFLYGEDENEHFFGGSYGGEIYAAEPESDPFGNIDENFQEVVLDADHIVIDEKDVPPPASVGSSLGSITMEPIVIDPNQLEPEVVELSD